MKSASFDVVASSRILEEIWETWVLFCVRTGSLLLSAEADEKTRHILATKLAEQLLVECSSVAEANGYNPRGDAIESALSSINAGLIQASSSKTEPYDSAEARYIFADLIGKGERARILSTQTALLNLVHDKLESGHKQSAVQNIADAGQKKLRAAFNDPGKIRTLDFWQGNQSKWKQ